MNARKPGFFDVAHSGYFMEHMVNIGPDTVPVIFKLIPEVQFTGTSKA